MACDFDKRVGLPVRVARAEAVRAQQVDLDGLKLAHAQGESALDPLLNGFGLADRRRVTLSVAAGPAVARLVGRRLEGVVAHAGVDQVVPAQHHLSEALVARHRVLVPEGDPHLRLRLCLHPVRREGDRHHELVLGRRVPHRVRRRVHVGLAAHPRNMLFLRHGRVAQLDLGLALVHLDVDLGVALVPLRQVRGVEHTQLDLHRAQAGAPRAGGVLGRDAVVHGGDAGRRVDDEVEEAEVALGGVAAGQRHHRERRRVDPALAELALHLLAARSELLAESRRGRREELLGREHDVAHRDALGGRPEHGLVLVEHLEGCLERPIERHPERPLFLPLGRDRLRNRLGGPRVHVLGVLAKVVVLLLLVTLGLLRLLEDLAAGHGRVAVGVTQRMLLVDRGQIVPALDRDRDARERMQRDLEGAGHGRVVGRGHVLAGALAVQKPLVHRARANVVEQVVLGQGHLPEEVRGLVPGQQARVLIPQLDGHVGRLPLGSRVNLEAAHLVAPVWVEGLKLGLALGAVALLPSDVHDRDRVRGPLRRVLALLIPRPDAEGTDDVKFEPEVALLGRAGHHGGLHRALLRVLLGRAFRGLFQVGTGGDAKAVGRATAASVPTVREHHVAPGGLKVHGVRGAAEASGARVVLGVDEGVGVEAGLVTVAEQLDLLEVHRELVEGDVLVVVEVDRAPDRQGVVEAHLVVALPAERRGQVLPRLNRREELVHGDVTRVIGHVLEGLDDLVVAVELVEVFDVVLRHGQTAAAAAATTSLGRGLGLLFGGGQRGHVRLGGLERLVGGGVADLEAPRLAHGEAGFERAHDFDEVVELVELDRATAVVVDLTESVEDRRALGRVRAVDADHVEKLWVR
mmetsp:Transcript_5952/g.13875  ORF Transcript_5952/g.13875 Transcript_5952/m.13875 type:complete len:859 (+) Transcript_5952:915-3491(+)